MDTTVTDERWITMLIETFTSPVFRWYWRFGYWLARIIDNGEVGDTCRMMLLVMMLTVPPSKMKELLRSQND